MKKKTGDDEMEITIALKLMKISHDEPEHQTTQPRCRPCGWWLHRTDGYCQQCNAQQMCYGRYPGADWSWCLEQCARCTTWLCRQCKPDHECEQWAAYWETRRSRRREAETRRSRRQEAEAEECNT